MRKNPLGDFVTGTLGGTLTAYFGIGALLILFAGQPLPLGPDMPVMPAPDSSPLMQLMVRLLQTVYFAGLAMLSFFGCRFMQELLRGQPMRAALREAATGPQLW